jgi:hypothetical protein
MKPMVKPMVRQLADTTFPSRVAFTMPTSRSLAGTCQAQSSGPQLEKGYQYFAAMKP